MGSPNILQFDLRRTAFQFHRHEQFKPVACWANKGLLGRTRNDSQFERAVDGEPAVGAGFDFLSGDGSQEEIAERRLIAGRDRQRQRAIE